MPPSRDFTRILAAAAIDAAGTSIAPAQAIVRPAPASARAGVHALELLSLETANTPAAAAAVTRYAPVRTIKAQSSLLTPGFVNAHTHLDLSHIPPIPFDVREGFMSFVRYVLANRLTTRDAIFASVAKGAALSRAGGVVAVGDIAGVVAGLASPFASEALAATGLLGTSYIEFFGCGGAESAALAALDASLEVCRKQQASWHCRLGVSPHAPYTVSRAGYAYAASKGFPLCTHLAENPEERAFVAHGSGAYRTLHENLGWWCEATRQAVGTGQSPTAYLQEFLQPELARSNQPYLLAHVNDASDADIELLAKRNACVVYSPRSSSYFQNHTYFGPHRYQAMLAAGIPVALGTDSVINLPPATVDEHTGKLSTLDEARLLFARDGCDPLMLLRMLTLNGACALGLPQEWFTLETSGDDAIPALKAGLALTHIDVHELNVARALMQSTESPKLVAITA